MSSYLVVHYNGSNTAFTPADTLDQARSIVLNICNRQHDNRKGIVSVVNVDQDLMVHYGGYRALLAELNPEAGHSRFPSLKSLLNIIRLKLLGLSFNH